ncbi:MAG TPA: metallophosphoesterase family protein [Anaerolineaceae bacterium]
MRILVFSDIHANLPALEAVLENAGDFDAAWCLGDLVGYGPNPNEVIERVRSLPNLICLLGNHDAAAIGMLDIENFNFEARQSILWVQNYLSTESSQFLKSLPEKLVTDEVTLAHGSPRSPIWEYILDAYSAWENLDHFSTPFCFVGHTHLPIGFHISPDAQPMNWFLPSITTPHAMIPRMILNPGSVGQPRDHNPRAAYAIYDTEQHIWSAHRVEYDVRLTQEHIRLAGLPPRHADRLAGGW